MSVSVYQSPLVGQLGAWNPAKPSPQKPRVVPVFSCRWGARLVYICLWTKFALFRGWIQAEDSPSLLGQVIEQGDLDAGLDWVVLLYLTTFPAKVHHGVR